MTSSSQQRLRHAPSATHTGCTRSPKRGSAVREEGGWGFGIGQGTARQVRSAWQSKRGSCRLTRRTRLSAHHAVVQEVCRLREGIFKGPANLLEAQLVVDGQRPAPNKRLVRRVLPPRRNAVCTAEALLKSLFERLGGRVVLQREKRRRREERCLCYDTERAWRMVDADWFFGG